MDDAFAHDGPGLGPSDPLASLAQGTPGPFDFARWYLEPDEQSESSSQIEGDSEGSDTADAVGEKCFLCDMNRQGLQPPSVRIMDDMVASGTHIMSDHCLFKQLERVFDMQCRSFVNYKCTAAMFRAHYTQHAPDPRVVLQNHLQVAQAMMDQFVAMGVMYIDGKAQPPSKDSVAVFSQLTKTTSSLLAATARLRSTGTLKNS